MKFTSQSMYLLLATTLFSCQEDTLFKLRPASDTGLDFNNEIEQHLSDTFNVLDFEYMYNGAGVAAGDVNNDGLLDLYFAGNFVSGKLYLNQGQLSFRDVTEEAKITTQKWGTGVSMVDINNDGWLDIYICVAGPENLGQTRKNQFFINQGINEKGIPEFKDMAAAYGLDDEGYSTMAAFLDYDKDNDLDVYILTNALENYNRNTLRKKVNDGSARNNDRLYRNNGDLTFTNVNQETGILKEGWGLGVCISDINQDGWPDIYVANDFVSNDLVWINQRDGTFVDKANDYLTLQTHNGMGVDIADYNNDLLPDIVVLDMLPEDNYREKMMIAAGNYDKQQMRRELGFGDQYMRNTLQLNQGKFPDGTMRFSEIGFISGINKTDWSWAPLMADYDNDGYKDLFIANGYRKDVTNMDYILYSQQSSQAMFGTEEAKEKKINQKLKEGLDKLEEVKVSNYIFKNQHDLTFKDVTKEWGLNIPSFSNGALYADLDNDGDLDIVTNNMDDPVMFFENTSSKNTDQPSNHYLRIKLTSENEHQLLFGSKVIISTGGKRQYEELNPYRGYKSSVEPLLHFGLARQTTVDSVMVVWPDNKVTLLTNIKADQLVTVDSNTGKNIQANLVTGKPYLSAELGKVSSYNYLFKDASASSSLGQLKHIENGYDDFKDTPMIPHLLSIYGPYAAAGDLNGDGLQDLVIGSDARQATQIGFQDQEGKFTIADLPGDVVYEDRSILIFDADGDQDNDVYVVSGGSEWLKGHKNYQDRLYLNDGKGQFTIAHQNLPAMTTSGSIVIGNDFDQDGDMDLFVGGYLVPREYPYTPKSYLLVNENGVFTDKTAELAPELEKIGMVTDAKWGDLNNDGFDDLVLVGEWMPLEIFLNQGNGQLTHSAEKYQTDKTNGWYHSVHLADIDKNGFLDIIAGNTGLNSYYEASEQEPIEIFTKDYDQTGSVDPIMTHYNLGKRYISFFRDQLINQINGMKGRFKRFDEFAKTTFNDSFTKEELKGAQHLQVNTLSSVVLENTGQNFIAHDLPLEAQLSSINDVKVTDINQDGHLDLILVGNDYQGDPIRGDLNASFGLLLLGNGDFTFTPVKPSLSGFIADGYCQQIIGISIQGDPHLLITRNSTHPLIYRLGDVPSMVP